MAATPETGRIERIRGNPIYFEVHGNGEPLLLLHGFSGSSLDWRELASEWSDRFQLIVPDLRGHGRSQNPSNVFRHSEAAEDVLGILDVLGIQSARGLGVSAGGNVLLHMATKQQERVAAMVIVSATSYFPEQARRIIRAYSIDSQTPEEQEQLSKRHPGGKAQIDAIISNVRSFAEIYDDMNFTPPLLSTIKARTLIVQGDRDPMYPVEISVEMMRAIPKSSLWVVPEGGHGPIFGERRADFVRVAKEFLSML